MRLLRLERLLRYGTYAWAWDKALEKTYGNFWAKPLKPGGSYGLWQVQPPSGHPTTKGGSTERG